MGKNKKLKQNKNNNKLNNDKLRKNNDKLSVKKRYALKFENENDMEIEREKELSRQPIEFKRNKSEIDIYELYPKNLEILLPIRPVWTKDMSKFELEENESKYFDSYLNLLKNQEWYKKLGYYEQNLETWRQLWRVIEKSDLIVIIVDIRVPILHFHIPLYNYIKVHHRKPVILVLNKIDLVPIENVIGWKEYFNEHFPQLYIVLFTSFPKDVSLNTFDKIKTKKKPSKKFISYGLVDLYNICHKLFPNKNFDSWKIKIDSLTQQYDDIIDSSDISSDIMQHDVLYQKWNSHQYQDFFTMGLIGFPNVGKSSFLNGVNGKKVTSVSRTPGHTKYFQTIFLSDSVVICDCPGLVFPSFIPKPLQILSGIFPISQLRQPYSSIRYLAENTNLIQLLHLQLPTDIVQWSAIDICSSWAIQRHFFTAKSGSPEIYRAANHILRMVVDGRIPFFIYPPNFDLNIKKYQQSSDAIKITTFLQKYSHSFNTNFNDILYNNDISNSDNLTLTTNRFISLQID